jgi:acetyl-CoA C-acetyltransferase
MTPTTGRPRPTRTDDIVICRPLRTPVGRYGGALRDVSAAALGAHVVRTVLDQSGLPYDEVDQVIFGHCYPTSEAPAIGRVIALDAGLPVSVPGMQLDRRCGSGLEAVLYAAAQIGIGSARTVIAGGTESMSQAAYYSTTTRWGARAGDTALHDALARGRTTAGGSNYPVPGGMIETAENLRRAYDISRSEQDQLSLASHRRATAAQDEGRFDEEIVPVAVMAKNSTTTVRADEHPRPGLQLDDLAKLRPVTAQTDPDATVTAGNASGQNDGAAACIVTTYADAQRLGLAPMGRLVASAVAGVAPDLMGIGPVPATAGALARAGLELEDIDLIELNEAFAAQVLAVTREWGFGRDDFERLNVNGSGISLGHPVGATGVRILATALHELKRRQARYVLETLCIGGGQGIAAIFERVPS